MRLLLSLVLFVLLAAESQSGTPGSAAGLWIYHFPWTSAPPEIVEDSGPQWYASGLLLNLCEGGRLRMATGVLYRGANSASLGSSDGLMLYEGQWNVDGETVRATYRLVNSEIRFTDMESEMQTQRVEHLRLKAGNLLFSFRHPGETKARNLRLDSAAAATLKFGDRFVECTAKAPSEPPNKSFERTREG